MLETIAPLLNALYGADRCPSILHALEGLFSKYNSQKVPLRGALLTEQDAILITYGDQIHEEGERPLNTLAEFCRSWVSGTISGIHILPFYPYSSDDGFSVIDYKTVDPNLGNWEDITKLKGSFRLMFDAVVNHVSAQSSWFQGFLQEKPAFRDYFITVEGSPDLSQVVRPRALPLLTPFETVSGTRQVWTTFSADQVDLNYQNPGVLLEIIDTLLFYASKGAEFIRLDAIAYLWKEFGTACIHHPHTHRVIQLMRAVLEQVAPDVMLITETNVPHEENISYFGNGENEAHMVYNFALPPLVLHALLTGDARYLSGWASKISLPSKHVTFFNFLASHDGIGINPARGILPETALEMLVTKTVDHGGFVSYKNNPDGSKSPYELNINYFDAVNDPNGELNLKERVDRFMASQAVMLSFVGVPGIYFHSLFGSRGWPEGVQQTGHNRTINRQKFTLKKLEGELAEPGSLGALVYDKYSRLLRARAMSPAFHPFGDQGVYECGERVFGLVRISPDRGKEVLCLQNLSAQAQMADLSTWMSGAKKGNSPLKDLVSGEEIQFLQKGGFPLRPYQTAWLERTLREGGDK
jgi:sucrose phosphorylase